MKVKKQDKDIGRGIYMRRRRYIWRGGDTHGEARIHMERRGYT